MAYVEEREFVLRLDVRCEFPEDYDGEEDGYVWASAFPALAAEIVQSALQIIGRSPGWKVHPSNRGRSSEDEITLTVNRLLAP